MNGRNVSNQQHFAHSSKLKAQVYKNQTMKDIKGLLQFTSKVEKNIKFVLDNKIKIKNKVIENKFHFYFI